MKTSIQTLVVLFAVLTIALSCKKEGLGGDTEIAAFPKHHGKSIRNAMVYVKYGAKESPGEDVSKYDISAIANSLHDGVYHAHFHDLRKGYYYIYSVGFDSSIMQIVKGGIPVKIGKSGEEEVDVPVTE